MPETSKVGRDLVVTRYEASPQALMGSLECGPRFGQAWRNGHEASLLPSTLSLQWTDSSLIAQAFLADSEVVTRASADGQRLWELGDTFEIFLGDPESVAYSEFHISPNGFKLALRFTGPGDVASARASGDLGPFTVPADVFQAQAGAADAFPGWKIEGGQSGWYAFASIPAQAVTGRERIQPNETWEGHFARYDYSAGGPQPVLSSTAPLRALDFHRRNDWNRLVFKG